MTTRIVVTMHGIRTSGRWQKEITPFLARHGLIPYHIDYGFFGLLRFLFPWTRESQIEGVRSDMRKLFQQVDARRVSLVAHSFGTFIAMEALIRENGNLKFDRIVLSGSILPTDFNWGDFLKREWVTAVRNQRATKDWVVTLARLMSCRPFRWLTQLQAGDSGKNRFKSDSPMVVDDFIIGKHSETHNPLQFEKWGRFLAYPRLSGEKLKTVRASLQAFRQDGARLLQYDVDKVRVNFFALMDGALRMIPSVCDNMTYAPEFDLEILPGQGGTGTAFKDNDASVLIKTGQSWSGNNLPTDELRKINPDLGWIVSLPVKGENGPVLGVVNIDGLGPLPGVLAEGSDDKLPTVIALQGNIAGRIEPLLAGAYWGEE